MAGHYLLYGIGVSERTTALTVLKAEFTSAFHRDVGWNHQSRRTLEDARKNGVTLENRNLLPPHLYMNLKNPASNPQTAGDANAAHWAVWHATLKDQSWIERLERPRMGLSQICPAAQQAWNQGRRVDSIIAQAKASPTVIFEIYVFNGKEV